MSSRLPTLAAAPETPFENIQFKAQPEDFVVEELPLYEFSGSGTHTYFLIEKSGVTTHEAVRRMSAALGQRAADAGVAGLKDAQAVTRQWISFEHLKQPQDELLSVAVNQVKVLNVTRHGNKLKMGHLRGNRFFIRLKTPSHEVANSLAARSREVLALLNRAGIPNFYGPQRFGRSGDNVKLGELLVRGDLAQFKQLTASSNRPPDRKLRNLFVNAFQSDLFNQVLARRMPDVGTLLAGDLACLHRNGAVFSVQTPDDAASEQPRADAHEISPSGPIFGPKMPFPEGKPGEIERDVLKIAGVAVEDFGRNEAERQPGARRPLRIFFLEEPFVESENESLVLRFALPSGAYATVVIGEILGATGAQHVLDA